MLTVFLLKIQFKHQDRYFGFPAPSASLFLLNVSQVESQSIQKTLFLSIVSTVYFVFCSTGHNSEMQAIQKMVVSDYQKVLALAVYI